MFTVSKALAASAIIAVCGIASASDAYAQPVRYTGEVFMTAAPFCPSGTALADGQLLPVAQYAPLFSVIGNAYGGDGRTNFALPDLRGRTPVHQGQGPGLSRRSLGERFGSEHANLDVSNLPNHSHNFTATAGIHAFPVTQGDQTVGVMHPHGGGEPVRGQTDATGGGAPFSIMQPSLVMNYCVVLQDFYPPRN